MLKTLLLTATLVLLLAFPAMAKTDCGELIDKSCTECHYKSRICQKIGKKNKRGWKTVIKRMLRHGLQLDKRDQKEVLKCLTGLEKGSKLVCE